MYAYTANDPVNAIDPTGAYERGADFTDEDWKEFDSTQKAEAENIESAANEARSAADALKSGKLGGFFSKNRRTIRRFNRVFGNGSATAENLTSVADALDQNASALRDDGSAGFVANSITTAEMDRAYPGNKDGHEHVAAGVPTGTRQFNSNSDHSARFSGQVFRHEPNHHFGRPDQTHNGELAYQNSPNRGQVRVAGQGLLETCLQCRDLLIQTIWQPSRGRDEKITHSHRDFNVSRSFCLLKQF